MIGTQLGQRYALVAELGRGGMGVVYRARDPMLDRDVAVKLIPPTHVTPETEQRFRREAQLVAQMDHPGIVPIYDFGRHDESLYLVMPVVPGKSLRGCLREGPLRLGDVLEIGIQAADALHHSHARGVIHRDVKPENLMVARADGEPLRVRVMDFGLAIMSNQARMTQTGAVVGTMGYLSPEQVLSRTVDQRSDVYSLGVVLYECLVGSSPFSGEMQSVLYRIVHEVPPPPSASGAAVDPELEAIVMSCLERDVSRRPQQASEVSSALRRYLARLHDSERTRTIAAPVTDHAARPALAPFVGREKELSELQRRLTAALGGECQLVLVGGEPGSGKTRLLDEIEGLARARKVRVLHGRFVEQDRSSPYQGFQEAIQEFFRRRDGDTGSGEIPDLTDLAAELSSLFPMVAEISEVRSAAARAGGAATAPRLEDRTHVFELLARTLLRLAGGRPLVLLLEELHAAEASIEALQYVVPRLGQTPILVVGTYRTTDVDRRHPLSRLVDAFETDRRFAQVELAPFTPSEHRRFLETLVGGPGLADDFVRRIHERTEGNPFFTKELVRSLLDAGALSRDESGLWGLAGSGVPSDALPATIQQAVEKRLQRVPPALRDVLSAAAVIGRRFDCRDLEALAGEDVDDAVDKLAQDGILEEERESRGDRLAFASGVLRDVLYAQLSRRKRRSLHRALAEHLEQRHKGRIERVYPELVHHFSEGDVPEKSVEYGLKLARHALDAFLPEDAARAARVALEFLDDEWQGDPAAEGDARALLARALRATGDVDSALHEFEAAAQVFGRTGARARVAETLLAAAETAWQARRADVADRLVGTGIGAARAAQHSEALGSLLGLGATLCNLRGEYDKASALREEARRVARAGRPEEAAEELPRAGRLVVGLSNPVKAREPIEIELQDELEVLANVFEPLFVTDPEGSVAPCLCESWQAIYDGRAFLLTLRGGVRFEDGHALTAADVRASLERAMRRGVRAPPAAHASILGAAEFRAEAAPEVAGLVVRSARELEIRLTAPLPMYPALLADFHCGIAREVTAPGGATRLYGTGAFRIASQEQGRVVLERTATHWGPSPRLDSVEFRAGVAAGQMAELFRAGAIDLARELLPEDLDRISRDPALRATLVETPRRNTYFALFRCGGESAISDVRVRRALASVVRPTDLVWRALGRFGQPASCFLPPGILGHDAGRRAHHLRREEARALLEQAGVGSGLALRACVHPVILDRCAKLVEGLFGLWSELGVTVATEPLDMKGFLDAWDSPGECDLLLGRWNANYDDPDDFTFGLFHSGEGRLRRWFASPSADRVLEAARAEARPAAREAHYRKFEDLAEEFAAFVPLFHDVDYRIAGPRVRGLRLRTTPPYVNYAELSKLEVAPQAAAEVRPRRGAFEVAMPAVVASIDPALASTSEDCEVVACVFETLTRDAGGGQVMPWLAESVSMEAAGRRCRIRLRQDVRFHDGRRLGARDVRSSFERLLQNGTREARTLLLPVRGAEAVSRGAATEIDGLAIESNHELTLDLVEPVSFFAAMLSYPALAVAPEGALRMGPTWRHGCVGTGPFRVAAFEPGRRLVLEPNPHYWRPGLPRCESLTFRFGVAPDEIAREFRAGRLSIAGDLFPADIEALRRDPEFARGWRETPSLSSCFIALNARRGPLAEVGARRALASGIDAAALVQQSLGRVAVPASGLIPPGLLGHGPSGRGAAAARVRLPQDLELRAAVHPVFLGQYAALWKALDAALARVGIRVRRVNDDIAGFFGEVERGEVDLVFARWTADYPDTDTFAHGAIHTDAGFYGRICGSADVDRLTAAARMETNPAIRHGVYRQVEEILAREALLVPLFHEQVYRIARPEVEGLMVAYWVPIVRYEELSQA